MTSLRWTSTRFPPQPDRFESARLLYDPEQLCLWLVTTALWRQDGTRGFRLVRPSVPCPFVDFVYFDELTRVPMLVGGTDKPATTVLYTFAGGTFVEVPTTGAAIKGQYDSFAYDPVRRALVHFMNKVSFHDDERPEHGAVRELVGGRWRTVGAVPISVETPHDVLTGWDAHRERILWVTPDQESETFAWDGHAWTRVCGGEEPPWVWHSPYVTHHPKTGELVVGYSDPSASGRRALLALGEDGWRELEASVSSVPTAVTFDSHEVGAVFWPWDDAEVGRFDGTKVRGDGVRYPKPMAIACGPRGMLLADECGATLITCEGELRRQEETPEIVDAWIATGERFVGISHKGRVLERSRGRIVSLVPAPREYVERRGTAIAWDPVRSLLVSTVGRDETQTHAETWVWNGDTFGEVRTSGRHPVEHDSQLAYHPELAVMVLAGGRSDDQDTPSGKTSHFDGTTWTSYATDLRDQADHAPSRLLAYDERSGHMFLLAWHLYLPRCVLWTYEGEGKWTPFIVEPAVTLSSHTGGVGVGVGYDEATRTVVAFGLLDDGTGAIGLRELALGGFLDALAKPRLASLKPGAKVPPSSPPRPKRSDRPAPQESPTPVRRASELPRVEHKTKRFLRLVDDQSNRFWFASVEDRDLVTYVGRDGDIIDQTIESFPSETEANAAFERAVAEKMQRGYEREAHASPTVAGRQAFVMHIDERGSESGDVLGGVPPGVDLAAWPRCVDCNVAMVHLATFHADEVRLPLEKHGAVSIFACLGTEGSSCASAGSRGGATRVLFLDAQQLAGSSLARPPVGPPESNPAPVAYTPHFEEGPGTSAAPRLGIESKLGGYPTGLGDSDVPGCAVCKKPMRFVGLIDSLLDRHLDLGDRGVGYLFICPDEHAGDFFWRTS